MRIPARLTGVSGLFLFFSGPEALPVRKICHGDRHPPAQNLRALLTDLFLIDEILKALPAAAERRTQGAALRRAKEGRKGPPYGYETL